MIEFFFNPIVIIAMYFLSLYVIWLLIKRNPYDEGAEASRQGLNYSDNPYAYNKDQAWESGRWELGYIITSIEKRSKDHG